MKRNIILTLSVLALICSCAKTPEIGKNDSAKRYFDSWIHVQKQEHPEYMWKQTTLGSYILEEEAGYGETIGEPNDSLFVMIEYTTYDLNGTITASTRKEIAQQLGSYNPVAYYGPEALFVGSSFAGIQELIRPMKVGGRVKAVIPGWLAVYDEYETAEDYLKNCSGSNTVYDFSIVDRISNINTWQIGKIKDMIAENYPDAEHMINDTTGFYYIRLSEPSDTTHLRDTTVYMNYIGRLLDGTVFDTNVRDTAVRHGLYSASRSYKPVSVSVPSESTSYSELKMDDSGVIKGFARTIWQMAPHEKGVGIFYSPFGYGYKGSGKTIPAYAPLQFEIEIVDKE